MSIRRTGDWEKIAELVANMSQEIEKANETSLKRFGLKAEGTAKKHMSNQDLGWEALKPATLANKVRKGLSENVLIATSSYFQAITSWFDKENMAVNIGVKKTAKDSDGNEIADIARVHEYGSLSGNIPARPLWKPTLDETIKWFKTSDSRPSAILRKNLKKYGV